MRLEYMHFSWTISKDAVCKSCVQVNARADYGGDKRSSWFRRCHVLNEDISCIFRSQLFSCGFIEVPAGIIALGWMSSLDQELWNAVRCISPINKSLLSFVAHAKLGGFSSHRDSLKNLHSKAFVLKTDPRSKTFLWVVTFITNPLHTQN